MIRKTIAGQFAPGWPGIQPRWTSSAKSGIGAAVDSESYIWFTHSHGILNEIYYPDVDQACIRDFQFLVANGRGFISEEKRQTRSTTKQLSEWVPAFQLFNTCIQNCYRIEKELIIPPSMNIVLQRTKFIPLKGTLNDYHLYALLAPHLKNRGTENTAWVDAYNGTRMLFACREDAVVALASTVPWLRMSVGFVGMSDAWQDINQHKRMEWEYSRAENGNVALAGEVDLGASNGDFTIALGFGHSVEEAAQQILKGLHLDFEGALASYSSGWRVWQQGLLDLEEFRGKERKLYRISTTVLHASESKKSPGGIIASLSIPWGFAKGDDDLGGYHLVWPRDLVESAGALLAAGDFAGAKRVVEYLKTTQLPDGHWPQNMWLHGEPYWNGIQMDETAFPILLVDLALREQALTGKDLTDLWPMVRKAVQYLVLNGPVTQQDRWEEDPGYSPFTLAVEISALLVAAEIAIKMGEVYLADFVRETADIWNASIERWTYVTNTALAKNNGVEGYYVRIAPPDVGDASSPAGGFVPIKNRPPGTSIKPAAQIVSPDALALVRFGLRAPKDPRIVNTVKVIDALLKTETPGGPVWHRYDDDGYGEHDDGSPFDGTGVGRGWPLMTGERAHFELDAGRIAEAESLFRTFESFGNEGGMIPEQIWDSPDIPQRELFFGRPSGSAMPLVWAHAEYVKLCRSLRDGKVFDKPLQTYERYGIQKTESSHAMWRFSQKCRSIVKGRILRLEVRSPAMVHWSCDGWKEINDDDTQDSGLGLHFCDLPTANLDPRSTIMFTFYWKNADRWEGTDFSVVVEP